MTHYQLETAWVMHKIHHWPIKDLARIYRVTESYLQDRLTQLIGTYHAPQTNIHSRQQ